MDHQRPHSRQRTPHLTRLSPDPCHHPAPLTDKDTHHDRLEHHRVHGNRTRRHPHRRECRHHHLHRGPPRRLAKRHSLRSTTSPANNPTPFPSHHQHRRRAAPAGLRSGHRLWTSFPVADCSAQSGPRGHEIRYRRRTTDVWRSGCDR